MSEDAAPAGRNTPSDLLSKIVIPTTLAICTLIVTTTAADLKHKQDCADRTMAMYDKICPNGNCDVPKERATQRAVVLKSNYALLDGLCSETKKKNFEYSDVLRDLVTASNPDIVTRTALASPNAKPQPKEVGKSGEAVPVGASGVRAPAPVAGALNVYVQYHLAEQQSGVDAVMQALNTSQSPTMNIKALGPQLVANARIATTQVRCFDTVSCKSAQVVANYIGALTGQTVPLRDFSQSYHSKSQGPLPLELWFSDAPITVHQ